MLRGIQYSLSKSKMIHLSCSLQLKAMVNQSAKAFSRNQYHGSVFVDTVSILLILLIFLSLAAPRDHLTVSPLLSPSRSSITSYLLYSHPPCFLQLSSSPHGVVSFSSLADDVVWRAGADAK